MQTVKISALVFGFALVTAACGDNMSSLNPAAPSALSPDSIHVEANAADVEAGSMANGPKPGNGNGNGNGNGGGNDNDKGKGNENGNGNDNRTPTNTSPNPTAPVPPGKSTVQFEGLVDAVGAASITVSGQVIKVTTDTVIRHGNRPVLLPAINPLDRVHVRASRVAAPAGGVGSSALATLEATEIKVQNPAEGTEPDAAVAVVEDPLVSVTAVDDSAVEQGANTGTFRLMRTGTAAQLAAPLSVSFALTGTASAADYAAVPLTATFLANQASVNVTVMPMNDGLSESPESVVLTLNLGTGYDLGSPATATVMIADAPPPVVSLSVPDPLAAEIANTGRFELTRTGNLSLPLTVTVEISGTATNGVDYPSLPATFTFLPGQDMIRVFVEPFTDTVVELVDETIVVTLVDGPDYDLGAEMTGVITIAAR